MGHPVKIGDVPLKIGMWWTTTEMTTRIQSVVLERYGSSNDVHEPWLKDLIRWLGIIRWYEAFPFTRLGDSGSRVFAEEYATIHLGIHAGCPTSVPNHSIFISLEKFYFERKRKGCTF